MIFLRNMRRKFYTWGFKLMVAVKRIATEKLSANMLSFVQEAAIMHKINQENVVRFYGVVLEPKNIMLV